MMLKTCFKAVFGLLLLWTETGIAQAQSFDDLASAITQSFPIQDVSVSASSDWCYQIESDYSPNSWNIELKTSADGPEAIRGYASEQGKRIRLIGLNKDNTFENFHSIYMGIDFLKQINYGLKESPEFQKSLDEYLDKSKPFSKIGSPNPQTNNQRITLPSGGGCPELKQLLPKLFYGDAQSWSPAGDPLCTDAFEADQGNGTQCKQLFGTPYWEKRKSGDFGNTKPAMPIFWKFNYRDDQLVGAYRFLILYCGNAELTKCVSYKTVGIGYLNVGYIGSGGA